jgi:predicted membrane channel-forming protein YqfA (hemolysin III family)
MRYIETWNVWTHLASFLLFGAMFLQSMETWLAAGDATDKLLLLVYVLSAQVCCQQIGDNDDDAEPIPRLLL